MTSSAKVGLVVALVAGAYLMGTWRARQSPPAAHVMAGPRILYYSCPMHPMYRSDRPGDCPSCGMRLEPVEMDDAVQAAGGGGAAVTGMVQVGPEKQHLIGIQVGPVSKRPGARTVRTTGRVAADENRLFRLNASTELWVRKVYPPATGSLVRKDEPLMDFYASNFLSSASAYLYALNTQDRLAQDKNSNQGQSDALKLQIRQAVESLQNLGVSDVDIAEMARTRAPRDLVTLRSPVDGYVLARNVSKGQWVGSSTELYQIADLSRVWIYADVFQNEARGIRPATRVSASAPDLGLSFMAQVSDIPPTFDAATRVTKVRLEAENPGLRLWPGMFVDVEFPIAHPPAITVPADAVIDSGLKRTVYVAKGNGYFEPRVVKTGWRYDGQVEILDGLAEGEQVVVAGNFMLDSESRMRMTAGQGNQAMEIPEQQAKASQIDPVCGMEVNPASAAGRSEYKGRTYYFCSDQCKRKFAASPQTFVH